MATLTLPADLTIAQLEPVRAELAAIVAATGPVTVKGAAVELRRGPCPSLPPSMS